MSDKIIPLERSVVPACDFDVNTFREVLEGTSDIEKIGGYKIGPALTGRLGYDAVVKIAREYTNKPLIFDAQKWGTDIPDTASKILTPLRDSGIDAVIFFPLAGPATEYDWIKTAQDLGLGVIVGGEMTHPRFLYGDASEGKKVNYSELFEKLGIPPKETGFIRANAPSEIYSIAARMGVNNFVVPGNKPDRVTHYKNVARNIGIIDDTYWAPGLITQGGNLSEAAEAAGESFHAIIGRDIYTAEDKRAAAIELTQKL